MRDVLPLDFVMVVSISEAGKSAPSLILQNTLSLDYPPGPQGEVMFPYCDFYKPEGNLLTITFSLRHANSMVIVERTAQIIFGCTSQYPEDCARVC